VIIRIGNNRPDHGMSILIAKNVSKVAELAGASCHFCNWSGSEILALRLCVCRLYFVDAIESIGPFKLKTSMSESRFYQYGLFVTKRIILGDYRLLERSHENQKDLWSSVHNAQGHSSVISTCSALDTLFFYTGSSIGIPLTSINSAFGAEGTISHLQLEFRINPSLERGSA
jgi:hypothetical protein